MKKQSYLLALLLMLHTLSLLSANADGKANKNSYDRLEIMSDQPSQQRRSSLLDSLKAWKKSLKKPKKENNDPSEPSTNTTAQHVAACVWHDNDMYTGNS